MNIIPKSKVGDCVDCNAKNTSCVKVGKSLYCIECRNVAKRKQQIDKASLRDKVRSLNEGSSASERQALMHDLDFVFSRYIRIKESKANGIGRCYTCDKQEHWTKLQLGHYIKRSETLLRWDSRNGKSQCEACNCHKHGNMDIYTERLNEEHSGLPEQLREESREINKFSREELKHLLIDYRAKLKMVESKFRTLI